VKKKNLTTSSPRADETQYEQLPAESISVGQWYWFQSVEKVWDKDTETYVETPHEWLGCVMHIGSNFLQLENAGTVGRSTVRVHFDKIWECLRIEPNPDAIINGKIEHYRALANKHLAEIKALTARLGVSSQSLLADQSAQSAQPSNALMVVSSQQDIKQYENALILAKDKQLPELFEAVKQANSKLTKWVTASTLPMEAATSGMKGTISDIKDRIFNISLYAGLTEEVVECRTGAPAEFHEKLHVMQRMMYMDEECLLNYRHGGMEFKDILRFDAWIAEDENRDRILPFPRCLVAMRVRRHEKERDWGGSLLSLFINIEIAQWDKFTYLYIRNGERVYRLSCDLDFGETIFPDKSAFDPGTPLMVKMIGTSVQEIITRDDYDIRATEANEKEKLADEWEANNPGASWVLNPHRSDFRPYEWKSFDPDNVYFDEIAETFAKKIKEHNRIALIIQGLYDRSNVLHPHPPVKIWSPEGFAAAITLIYDGEATLDDGDAPDFEAYRQRCNETLGLDSVVIGQELYWEKQEAEKESRRRDNDWRNTSEYRPTTFRPYGNPGPGYMARMAKWESRAKRATFTWNRERRTSNYYEGKNFGDPIPTSITVPVHKLFNVSAYQPGDYLQFFQDHRTREQYLKWAPMLLAAEEYHAGRNMGVQNPI
jgi:hypothetical protein